MSDGLGVVSFQARAAGEPIAVSADLSLRQALRHWQGASGRDSPPLVFRVMDGDRLLGTVSTAALVEAILTGGDLDGTPLSKVMQPAAEVAPPPPTETPLISDRLLGRLALSITASLKLDDILQTAVTEVRQLLKCDRVLVYDLHPNGNGTVIAESTPDAELQLVGRTVTDPCFADECLQAYSNGRVQICHDIYADDLTPCHVELLESLKVRANLVVPIRYRNASPDDGFVLWGLLVAQQCQTPRLWHPEEADLFEQLGSQLAVAIRNAELYQQSQQELRDRIQIQQQLQQRTEQALAIADLGQLALDPNLTLDDLAATVARLLGDTLGTDCAAVWELHSQTSNLWMRASWGWKFDSSDRPEIPLNSPSPAGDTLVAHAPLACDNFQAEPRFSSCFWLRQHHLRSSLTVPLGGRDRPFGVLGVYSCQERVFSEDEVHFVQSAANLLAAAIESDRVRRELDYFFELSLDLLCIGSTNGRFERVNPQFEAVLGYTSRQLCQQSFLQLVHLEDRPATRHQLKQLAQGHSILDFENRFLCADGSWIWLSWTAFPTQEPGAYTTKQRRFYAVARDVTERKRAEQKLRQLNQRLETTIEERTEQLSASNRQLSVELVERSRRARQQAIVAELGQLALSQNDLTQFIDVVVSRVTEGLDVDYCKVLERAAPPYDLLTLGSHPEVLEESILFEREPLLNDNREGWVSPADLQLHQMQHGNGMALAIRGKQGDLGVLGVYGDRPHCFSRDDLHFLQSVANLLAGAMERQQADTALRHSEERFRIALKNSPIVVFNQDLELRYTWIYNPALGYRAEEVIGATDADLFDPEDAAALAALKQQVITTETGIRQEIVLHEKGNAEFKCYDLTIDPLYDDRHRLLGITCTALDISDRKQAELALQESQHLISRIAEASPNILYIYDLIEQRNIYTNQGVTSLLGYTPETIRELGNHLFVRLIHPEDLPRVAAHHARIAEMGESSQPRVLEVEYRLRDRQGKWHWFVSRDTIFTTTDDGRPAQILGAASDITERKEFEERLRLSERAIAGSSNGIVIADARQPDLPLIFVNPAFEMATGYSASEVIGRNCRFLQGSDRQQSELKTLRDAIRHRQSCTVILRNYRKDGSLFWNELNISPIFDEDGCLTHYLGIQNDITEFRKQDIERRIVQKRLEYLLSSSPGILYSLEGDGHRATFVSQNAKRLLGYSQGEVTTPDFWVQHIHPEDAKGIFSRGLETLFATGNYSHEYRFRHADGTYRWIYDQMTLIRDDAGQPLEIIGYWVDISDRKQAEEALRHSEARYRLMADNSTDLIGRHTPDGVYRYASPACRTLLGYEPEELVGRSAYEFFHPDDLAAIQHSHESIIERPDVQTVTYRIRRSDGCYIWFETTSRTVRDPQTGAVREILAVSRDISDRKHAEDQLVASLREKELLLKEIHHRVKNNLLVVSSLLEFQIDYTNDPDVVKVLRDSQNRVASMALIHEKLYRSTDLARIDFSEYLSSLVESLVGSYEVGDRNIDWQLDLEPMFLNIETAQPCGLVVNELLSNAFKHAFPDGSSGTVSLELKTRDDGKIMLSVSDNGVGFPHDLDFDKIDSLGIELVCTLAKQLRAELDVKRDGGTAFTLVFSELHYRKRV